MGPPRTFAIRHGETEWSRADRLTGRTDLDLTENGKRRMAATGKAVVGKDKLISGPNIAHVYCSPRQRARKTLELLNLGLESTIEVEFTENLREWDYGDYEGLTIEEVENRRKAKGLDNNGSWDIWRDGCEGGESPTQVQDRVDKVISAIRSRYQTREAIAHSKESGSSVSDILCVAHGHTLIAFATRWVGMPLTAGPRMLLEAGGVGVLSYDRYDIREPALLLGGGSLVDTLEGAEEH